jgi:hypothetical protein
MLPIAGQHLRNEIDLLLEAIRGPVDRPANGAAELAAMQARRHAPIASRSASASLGPK